MSRVSEGQFLSFKNVISKKYQLNIHDYPQKLAEFQAIIDKNQLIPSASLFISINGVLNNQEILLEFFMPLKNTYLNPQNLKLDSFRTYFFIDNLIATRVLDNFETNTPLGIQYLSEYANQEKMEVSSPFFIVFENSQEKVHADIYLQAARNPETIDELRKIVDSF